MPRSTETGPTTTDLGNGDRSTEASAGEGRKLNITVTQIGASAGAAATSALGASFFGAGGTITGAALGAVISTVAGAVYNRSLESAGDRLKDTKVLVRRVPVGLRSENPEAVPTHLGREVDAGAARQAAANGDPEPAAEQPTEPLVADGDGAAATALMADAAAAAAADRARDTGTTSPPTAALGTTQELPLVTHEPQARPRRRQVAILGGVSLAGFGLAIGAITVAESLLGHPVSGGDGGTTVSKVVDSTASETTERETEPGPATTTSEPEATTPGPEATTTPEDEVTPTSEPTEEPTEAPAETPTGDPAPTDAPAETGGAEEGAAGEEGGELGAADPTPSPEATN